MKTFNLTRKKKSNVYKRTGWYCRETLTGQTVVFHRLKKICFDECNDRFTEQAQREKVLICLRIFDANGAFLLETTYDYDLSAP